jgi:hypothetical protein
MSPDCDHVGPTEVDAKLRANAVGWGNGSSSRYNHSHKGPPVFWSRLELSPSPTGLPTVQCNPWGKDRMCTQPTISRSRVVSAASVLSSPSQKAACTEAQGRASK